MVAGRRKSRNSPIPAAWLPLIRYFFPGGDRARLLLHSGPDSTKRERGTIWLSQ